jgi:hypothetical protein
MSDGLTLFATIAMAAALFICVAIIVRRLWRTVTDPHSAYRIGRSTRKFGEGAANVAGRAAGTAEAFGRVINRSFQEGRRETNGGHDNRD